MRPKRGGENAEELDGRETGVMDVLDYRAFEMLESENARLRKELQDMTKKEFIITEVTCNRCAHEDKWLPSTPDYLKLEWSSLAQGEVDFDLCPSCTREVKAWIRNGR